jgi:hypothetical protein
MSRHESVIHCSLALPAQHVKAQLLGALWGVEHEA